MRLPKFKSGIHLGVIRRDVWADIHRLQGKEVDCNIPGFHAQKIDVSRSLIGRLIEGDIR
jgi:hypothetical protein